MSNVAVFSGKAGNYDKYRARHPTELSTFLADDLGMDREHTVADIGSGTGLLTSVLLDLVGVVHAVEPNAEMKAVADQRLQAIPGYRGVLASAEATSLPDASVDFVTAGDAFHWFDPVAAKAEFSRILRGERGVVLAHADFAPEHSDFLTDFKGVIERNSAGSKAARAKAKEPRSSVLSTFFSAYGYRTRMVGRSDQLFDYEALKGRLLSMSFTPNEGDDRHAALVADVEALFLKHERDGGVSFKLAWYVVYGSL